MSPFGKALRIAAAVVALSATALQTGCLSEQSPTMSAEVASCVKQYRVASSDPLPSGGPLAPFKSATYAVPCPALVSTGMTNWSVLAISPDQSSARIYFIGSPVEDKCGLLRKVDVHEDTQTVRIGIELGADPTLGSNYSCSAAGFAYVTNIVFAEPIGNREVVHPPGATIVNL